MRRTIPLEPSALHRVEQIWVVLQEREVEGERLPNYQGAPLVCVSPGNVRILREMAVRCAQETQLTCRLVSFSKREDLETYKP